MTIQELKKQNIELSTAVKDVTESLKLLSAAQKAVDDAYADNSLTLDEYENKTSELNNLYIQQKQVLEDNKVALENNRNDLALTHIELEALNKRLSAASDATSLLTKALKDTPFESFASICNDSVTAVKALHMGQVSLNAAFKANPIGFVVTLCISLYDIFQKLTAGTDGFVNKLKVVWQWVKDLGTVIKDFVTGAASAFLKLLKGDFQGAIDAYKNVFSNLISSGRDLISVTKESTDATTKDTRAIKDKTDALKDLNAEVEKEIINLQKEIDKIREASDARYEAEEKARQRMAKEYESEDLGGPIEEEWADEDESNSAAIRKVKAEEEAIKSKEQAEIAAFETTKGIATAAAALEQSGIVKSKAARKALKAVQIAAAIADTYKSAQAAFSAGMETGGPWAPAVAAAYMTAAIATGLANVAAIKNSDSGGASAAAAASSPVAVPQYQVNTTVMQYGETATEQITSQSPQPVLVVETLQQVQSNMQVRLDESVI